MVRLFRGEDRRGERGLGGGEGREERIRSSTLEDKNKYSLAMSTTSLSMLFSIELRVSF